MSRMGSAPIRIGVAGWDYRDWKGIVYPQPRPKDFDPLRYLAGYLDLIEINSTFYRPPTAAVARRWVQRVRDVPAFRFTAKLHRRFTHERTTAGTEPAVVNALQFRKLITGETHAAPEPLVAGYGAELRGYVESRRTTTAAA